MTRRSWASAWWISAGHHRHLHLHRGRAIRHTAVIPIAGDQVTNDIAMALRTPTQYAEEIKIRYACALAKLAGAGETKGPQRWRSPSA